MLRIGGSVLGSPPDPRLVAAFADVLRDVAREHSLGVVVGGGQVARQYIHAARAMGLPEGDQDTIAIEASRLNAKLVSMRLGIKKPIPHSTKEMLLLLERQKVAVMGGLRPGITTDTVAVLLAKEWKADLLLKASNREGIYDSDPALNKRARLLRRLSYARLRKILGGSHSPGIHSIVDPVAVDEVSKARIKLVVIDGRDPKNVQRAAHGQKVGTAVF